MTVTTQLGAIERVGSYLTHGEHGPNRAVMPALDALLGTRHPPRVTAFDIALGAQRDPVDPLLAALTRRP